MKNGAITLLISNTDKRTKVVFYFPWLEVSGGPIYLTGLADKLAEDPNFDVYYTDYSPGLSDNLLKNSKVTKITVSTENFSIGIEEPVVLITPIYWACWVPKLHPDSKILFFNWHICSIPVLIDNWKISPLALRSFLEIVQKTDSVFFCDYSHWMAQNTKKIIFNKRYVPISLPSAHSPASSNLVEGDKINVGVLGRLSLDKVFSVLNLLDNLSKLELKKSVVLHVIGDGPEKSRINPREYQGINIKFVGTVTGDHLTEYLREKIDILFGMGTSILEGAALRIPSVVIPHNVKPMECDRFVYLQDSKDYCLGWYDDQIEKIGLKERKLKEIIDEVYENGRKEALGQDAYNYYLSHHTIESAIKPFKEIIESSSLTYSTLQHVSAKNLSYRPIAGSKHLGFEVTYDGKARWIAFSRWRIATLDIHGLPMRSMRYANRVRRYLSRKMRGHSTESTLITWLQSFESRIEGKINQLKSTSEEHYRDVVALGDQVDSSQIAAREELRSVFVDHSSSLMQRFDDLSSRLDTLERSLVDISGRVSRVAQANVVQMDTCDSLVSSESFDYFCGDISKDYRELIAGLDKESIDVVSRAISRAQQYWLYKTSYFWQTDAERIELTRIMDQHTSNTVRLSGDVTAYGKYILPINIISSTVFYYRHFLPEVRDLQKISNLDIIDAGGFIGDSALILSEYTNREVHVFEPVSSLYKMCEETVRLNGLSNVKLVKYALGERHGTSSISIEGDTSHIIVGAQISDDAASELVKVIPLDDYVEEHKLSIGLIKVDIEGFESEFLKGAKRTISSQKPVLLLSIYHNADDFFHIKTLIEGWDLGYRFKIRKPFDNNILVDTTLICEA